MPHTDGALSGNTRLSGLRPKEQETLPFGAQVKRLSYQLANERMKA